MKTFVNLFLGVLTGLIPVVNIRYFLSHYGTPDPTIYDIGVVMALILEIATIIIVAAVFLF